jgi:FkbM family methyltransferase
MKFDKTPWILRALRIIPSHAPGKARFARLLMEWLKLPSGMIEIDVDGLSLVAPSIREPIATALAIHGVYEPETVEWLCRVLKPTSTLVDVGANIGVFALMAAQRLCPQGRVIAIEASPGIYACLERNCAVSGLNNVVTLHSAAAALPGVATFYDAPAESFGMGSLAARFKGGGVEVPMVTLDAVVAEYGATEIAAIKIDVEGFEADVLRGANRILSQKDPPQVLFEFNDWAERREGCYPGAAQEVLLDHGYSLAVLERWLQDGSSHRNIMREGSANLVGIKV